MGLKRYMVDRRASPHIVLHELVIFKSPHPVICPCKLVIHVFKMPTTANQHIILNIMILYLI